MKTKKTLGTFLAAVLVTGVAAGALLLDWQTIPEAEANMPDLAPSPEVDPFLPAYPGADETRVGREMWVNGQSMNLNVSTVNAPPEDVAQHYEAAMDKQGAKVIREVHQGTIFVSALTQDGRQVGVSIQPMDENDGLGKVGGRSLVLPMSATGVFRPGFEARQHPLPLPEDAEAVVGYRSFDGNRVGHTAQFVTSAKPDAMRAFYTAHLEKLGYHSLESKDEPADENDEVVILRFGSGSKLATVSIQGMGESGSAIFLLHEDHDA